MNQKAVRRGQENESEVPRRPHYVQSVEKAMNVLRAFDGVRKQLSLTQIAERSGMTVSAAQRFTSTLTALGYLNKSPQNKKFELAPRILDFTYRYLSGNELLARATPVLQQLTQETGEVCSMTVLDDTEIVFVARIISRNILNYANLVVGARLPAYCTSSGRAMLATLPEKQLDDVLERSVLEKHTPHTLVDVASIKSELQKIRVSGFALIEDQYYLGDVSIGAAVLDAEGHAVGGISIALSRARWEQDMDLPRYSVLIMEAAHSLSVFQHL